MRVLLCLALAAFPVAAAQPQQVEVRCDQQNCMIRKDSLVALLEGTQKMSQHIVELRVLCGWERR